MYIFTNSLYNSILPITYDCFHVSSKNLEVMNCFCSEVPVNCFCIVNTLSALPSNEKLNKFAHPRVNPQPSNIVDNRTPAQKMASILRTLSQFLNEPQLEVWNSLVERHLHLSSKFKSRIPKIKAQISDEIKKFRLSQENKKCCLRRLIMLI